MRVDYVRPVDGPTNGSRAKRRKISGLLVCVRLSSRLPVFVYGVFFFQFLFCYWRLEQKFIRKKEPCMHSDFYISNISFFFFLSVCFY